MSRPFTESVVEEAALTWLAGLGYAVLHGPDIAAGMPAAERADQTYRDVVLTGRSRQVLVRLNHHLPPDALEDAYRRSRFVQAGRERRQFTKVRSVLAVLGMILFKRHHVERNRADWKSCNDRDLPI